MTTSLKAQYLSPYNPTKKDLVAGVKQKPLASGVRQVESWLQVPLQSDPLQCPMSLVAEMHCVPGASMHADPPTYTRHSPPQISLSSTVVQ